MTQTRRARVLGVDLGGTNVRAAVYSPADGMGALHRMDTPDKAKGMDAVVEVLVRLFRAATDGKPPVEAVGIGIPGITHADTRGSWAPNLGWTNAPLEAALSRALRLPVRCENDANLAALAESHLGAGKGFDSMLMLTLGTGIGGGWVRDGALHTGAHGWAGEIGHMCLVLDGLQCNCGRRGCFERYASARALGEQGLVASLENPQSLLARQKGRPDAAWVQHCAALGDQTATKVWLRYVDFLAAGVASLCSLLDPDCVVLGGGIANAGEALTKPLRARLQKLRLSDHAPLPELLTAKCGDQAGVLGAALCALSAWDTP